MEPSIIPWLLHVPAGTDRPEPVSQHSPLHMHQGRGGNTERLSYNKNLAQP